MENASKALYIVAGVFIGVLIISLAVYLFTMFGDFSGNTQSKMEAARIAQLNTEFTKYYGSRDGEPIKCTIHDIVNLVKLAKEYSEYDIKIIWGADTNLVLRDEDRLIELIEEYDINEDNEVIYWKCDDVVYNGDMVSAVYFSM